MYRRRFGLMLLLLCQPWALLAADTAAISPQRAAELDALLHQDCGSCHGLRLTGGLGPALTREALAGKPPALLAQTIRDGRPGTPMPPWKPILSEADIQWMVETIQNYEAPK